MKIELLDPNSGYDSWDAFLQESPRGHYVQLSTYLKSFQAYGAVPHIFQAREDKKIVGGIGLLVFGKGPFRLVTAPTGPIVEVGYENCFEPLVKKALEHSSSIGAFLFQIRIPYRKDTSIQKHVLSSIQLPEANYREGFPFKVATAAGMLYLVDLGAEPYSDSWEERLLGSFKKNTRRDVRRSMTNDLNISIAETDADIRNAYAVIEQNGVEKGYGVRSWSDFGQTLIEQVNKRQAIVMTVKKDGRLLAAHYGVIAGKRYSHVLSGVKRIEKDCNVGHFLHWNAIKKAKALGCISYDFVGHGTPGVHQFKSGFCPEPIIFDNSSYYVVLSETKYFVFSRLLPLMKRQKAKFAKVAKLLLGNM